MLVEKLARDDNETRRPEEHCTGRSQTRLRMVGNMSLLTFRLIAASLSTASLALITGGVAAQSTAAVAGTYSAVSIPVYGDKPRGMLLLAADGYYSLIITRADMPKIAGGARTMGTPEENKAVVDGSIAHFGRYTVDDGGKAITFNIDTSTFPNWNGTTQKRGLKVEGDRLTYSVATPSGGGAPTELTWKRVK
jgi:Lipocalin-like domain